MNWRYKENMPLSTHDRERIEDIVAGYGDWFSAHLIRLIAKADSVNMEILRTAYPDHVEAYEDWYYRGDPTYLKIKTG